MSRLDRRAARVRTDVSIEQVLASYGYEVRVQGGSREQQFRCDLHGDGMDSKPSARCYPENNSWYCWACRQSRDAIQTVREKDGLNFGQALEKLERMFNLPSLPWEEGDLSSGVHHDPLAGAFDAPVHTFESEARRVQHLIQTLCDEKMLALTKVLEMAEEYDHLMVQAEIEPSEYIEEMGSLRRRLIESMRGS